MSEELKSLSCVKRYPGNPVLTAADVPYRSDLVFNAGIIPWQDGYAMIFRNDYGATKEEISAAMAATRSVKRATRKKLEEIIAQTPPEKRLDALDLNLRKAEENIASEDNIIKTSDMIEMMLSGDTRQENNDFGEDVVIDYARMNAMLEASLQEVN